MEANYQINIKIFETEIIQLIEIIQKLPNVQIHILSAVQSILRATKLVKGPEVWTCEGRLRTSWSLCLLFVPCPPPDERRALRFASL